MFNIGKAFLEGFICISIAQVAFSSEKRPELGLLSKMHSLPGILHKSQLSRNQNVLAKTTAAQWKQVGAVHYYNSSFDQNSVWELGSRDTTIFDAAGNEIINKTSSVETGWDLSSLESLDSNIYKDGRLTENLGFYFQQGPWENRHG